MSILVTGATGSVGGHVVAGLVAAGVPVRALVRSAATLPGASTVRGDLRDPASLAAAAAGTDAVFLVWVDTGGGLDPAAVRALAEGRRVILLSAINAGEGDGGSYGATERLVAEHAASWTFLRAGGFAKNALGWAPAIRAGGPVRLPVPRAGRSSIHERDVADAGVAVLTGSGHDGAVHSLTGPSVLTLEEHVHAIGSALGRDLRVEQQSREEAVAEIAAWSSPEVADEMLSHWQTLVEHPEPVSHDVERITGVPARTFARWARDHVADFH